MHITELPANGPGGLQSLSVIRAKLEVVLMMPADRQTVLLKAAQQPADRQTVLLKAAQKPERWIIPAGDG